MAIRLDSAIISLMDSQPEIKNLLVRPATLEDESWLWEQYSKLLGPSIHKQWGWNGISQRSNFRKHLPYTMFRILEQQKSKVAAYAVKRDQRCIYLHMLLVVLEYQRQGIGARVLKTLKSQSRRTRLPIELIIIPAKPVTEFYDKQGFNLIEATADKRVFRWTPG